VILILAAMALALASRGISAWASGPAGPQEVRYITIAQGILEGRGFHGLDKRFPDIIQPPLHPLLLAGALLVGGDPLTAARTLTVILGTLLIVPIALLAWRLYGSAAAWRAAWLVAIYPLLVHFSGLSLTEPAFGLLVACAVLALGEIAAGSGRSLHVAAAGASLGLAFLARPEGLAYMAAGLLFLFLLTWIPLRRGLPTAAAWSGIFLGVFLAFALPYSVWLHARTDHWLVSPKAVLTQVHNMLMTEGIREDWPEREGTAVFYERVKFGLNEEGTELRSSEAFRALGLLPSEEGPSHKVNIIGEVIQPAYLFRVLVRNFRILYLDTLKYGLVLPTIFLGLLALGITSRPWAPGPDRRSQILMIWFLMAGCSWALSYVQERFLYTSMALVVIWISQGWVRLEEWLSDSFLGARGSGSPPVRRVLTAGLAVTLGLAALVHAIPPARRTRNLWENHRVAGEKLREIARGPDSVMALTPVVPFYAGLDFELLPYAGLEQVLVFGRHRGARFLVADLEMFPLQRPQLADLAEPQLAPESLETLLITGSGGERRVIIYEMTDPAPHALERVTLDP
jgi:4-amino-4-deoxy-L-arabinose transferase-like glycosyltransferase